MSIIGSTASTHSITDTASRVNGIAAADVPAGVLTDISVYVNRTWTGGSWLRVGVYQGGTSDDDPTGATLIYDSGEITITSIATLAWYSLTTDFGKTVSGSVAASRTWIVLMTNEVNIGLNNTNSGALTLPTTQSGDSQNANAYIGSDTTTAFPLTFPTYTATGGSETMMVSLDILDSEVEQEGFRFGEDDGDEASHTWAAAQDTNLSAGLGVAKLIRALLNATDDPSANPYALRYQKNGSGGYLPVPIGTITSPTLSWGAAGTIAYSASAGTSVAPTYPSGITANSALVLVVGQKPGTANGGTVTTPSGWTLQGSTLAKGGYSTTLGADTGNTNLLIYTKDSVSGSESGTLSVTLSDNGVTWANIYHVASSAACTWSFAEAGDAEDTSSGDVSLAFASDPGVTAGDFIIAGMCIPTDVTTPSQFSAEAITQTGVTFGTVTEIQEPDSTTGNDIGGFMCYSLVSSGTSSAAPTLTATAGGTTTNVRGPGVFLRLRATGVANELYIAASSNITAGGEATTARLTAPSGKTTGDFVTGRRWDDENGTDTIDITTDDYTEVEWCINTQSPAANGDYFDLRIYNGSGALSTYTVTPRLTLSDGASASVTGVSGTGEVGTLTENHGNSPAVTGVEATGGVGTVTTSISGDASASLSGVQATASPGSLSGINVDMTLTTLLATANVGTVTQIHSAAPTLTGVAATSGLGALAETHNSVKAITSVGATGNVGTLSASSDSANVNVPGVGATANVGTLSEIHAANVVLTGLSAVGEVGLLSAQAASNGSANVIGVAAEGFTNALVWTINADRYLTGIGATAEVGTLNGVADGSTNAFLSGVQGQAIVGDLLPYTGLNVTINGVSAVGQLGSITVDSTSMAYLLGVSAIASAGYINFYSSFPPAARIFKSTFVSRITYVRN